MAPVIKADSEVEAAAMIRDHGDAAYETAQAAVREARNRGDAGLERYFGAVAAVIAERTGRHTAEDMAIREVS